MFKHVQRYGPTIDKLFGDDQKMHIPVLFSGNDFFRFNILDSFEYINNLTAFIQLNKKRYYKDLMLEFRISTLDDFVKATKSVKNEKINENLLSKRASKNNFAIINDYDLTIYLVSHFVDD